MRCEDLHVNVQDASGDRILAGSTLNKDPTTWNTRRKTYTTISARPRQRRSIRRLPRFPDTPTLTVAVSTAAWRATRSRVTFTLRQEAMVTWRWASILITARKSLPEIPVLPLGGPHSLHDRPQ
ncbi:2527_t:CDS:2, partial [Scutellospora calospora]